MVTEKVPNQSDGNTAFLRAARSGNLDKVLEFINANVDINTSNSNGLNALHLASKDGHTEVVAELLKRGAHVDAATKKGNTALHIASLAGQEEVVKLLIEHGALVNVQSQSGFTPLYMAAQENHEKVVRYLLNHGANQSLATEDGFTPLAVAMQQGHDKVVTELLENDTRGKIRLPALHIAAKKDDCKAAALLLQSEHNPDITSKSGFTPLHIASHYGNDAIASLLLAKGADVNYAAKHNITPLHVAAKWGRNNMVVLLLDKGASIMAKTRDGLTPLHCAARSGHEQVVDTLLQRHAPITAKTKNGLAPLHMASQGDHVEAARVLLTHRAPVDDVTVDYLTALHVASHCGHVSVAKLLLDRKADPNARALNGFTPLHIACKKNRVKIVELLLKQGASIEATTESGLSPLHVASFMGCMNIVIYLLQCEANPDVSTIRGETPLHLASRANQTDIIRILLRNGAQVDAKAREQQTPLHIASRLGNTDIVMLLLQHGANVDSVTKDLYTSMHIAAKEDQEEVIQTLLENEASMTAATKKGFTPLHLAAKYGRTKIATLLLQRGAPVDAQGKNGVTPLHVASHYDHQGIALLLLDKGASPHATAKNGHTPLHIAAKKNQMDIAAMLLEYGARADVESKAGFTPLHLAAQEGHVDMTNLLLEHKCDVNYSSKNGLTPLHLCAQEDCVEVAKILVRNGADANTVTKAGYTPLHIASHFGQLNMVRFLLSQKVKVDAATSTGYTPLHQAAQQGNSAIVAVLLDNGASPNSKNNQGLTALYIAQKLGYISVVEVLKNVTKPDKGKNAAPGSNDDKYKVVAPETMQENFMSDSEDEGGDDATNEQSYRYLTIDEMKSLGDDSMPLDVSKEDRYDTTAGVEESITPQHNYNNQFSAVTVPDNVDVTRTPVVQTGFLVSFLVDAKGGAMRGCRHSGVRVIVPPQCVTMPTRVTCRYVRRDKPNPPPPPPLMEGEALASRILELGPVGVKFLGPVVIEVPNFAALRGNEREIVILRSDNGETWREHTVDSSTEAVRDILSRSFDKDGNQLQTDEPNRITSIVTTHFPHYFAVVSRIRQEVHAIGPEGGMVSSSVVPQVQAVFPPGALTKKIKVGLQAQPIPSELTAAVLGNCVAVSPIVTIEPRRRKFHKKITLTLPVPQAANKGMINQYSGDAPTLRLLCSITGGTSRAQWEDVTGTSPLTFVKECVSFTTNVSARFWLMDIRDVTMATKKATELYREAILTPFMVKFVVFAKRIDNDEARLRVFCMTDDKEDKTLECQEHFTEVAKSRDVEVLEGKKQLVELSGNLISVTKAGDQLKLGFNPFHENRLPFTVRIKDSLADPIGRMLFFKEQKPVKTSTPHPPICVLNIVLPDGIIPDPEYLDSPLRKYSFLNDSQSYHKSELPLVDVSNMIDEDWVLLAEKLGISSTDVNAITFDCQDSVSKQALTMLQLWHRHANNKSSLNILENALLSIGRQDIVQECILNASESKRRQNGDGIYTNGISNNMIENYHSGKRDLATTDDDEKKYTGEEKAIDEPEIKKSVCERKMEIEKRLQHEKSQRSSVERSDSNEKRRSLEHETVNVVRRQNSQNQDVTRTDLHDENDSVEPTSLTFEQKRLSFERGYSVDKVVSEGDVCKIKPEETIKTDNDEKAKPEEKRLSFAEKRLSFEQSSIPSEKKEVPTSQPQRSAEDKRRDSELLEGVSVGLGKFDVERSVIDQSCLSLKPSSTPPPSPAEFKKQDSVDSDKSSKHVSKQVTAEDVVTSPEVGAKSEKPASGDIQQHSYSDSNTSLNCTRVVETEVSKQDSMDYNSKKKFWQSFETSSVSESKPAPVPKPRASICTTSVRDEKPPLISKRSAENVMKPSNTRREKVHKSESEDNVLFAAANAGSKSTIRQMHSVTAYSTDSEAEYIAACGVEKLAYENVAFSEEEEDRSLDVSQSSEGGVKAKKMFFESQQKEISTSREDSFTHPPPSKTDSRSSTVEEHIDKSELESTEKKKTSLVEETDDLSAATPNDINSTNGYSAGDNADSTQSESDITPEDLKDKQDSLPGSESISHGSHQRTDSDHSTIGQLEIDTEINKVKEEIRVSKRDPETKLDDKVITKDSLVDKVVPEEKITKDVVVEVSSNKPLEDVVTRKASVESSSETVTAEVTKNETPAVVSNSSTTADKCPVKTKETISTSDAVDTSPPHESKIERVEGLETPTSPVQRPFDENVDRKPNSESKIPLFKRSSTAENLKTGSKSLKSDGSIESQASVKSSSIMDKSTDDQSESDNSSYSDLKSTPTRIPVAKSPPSTSQSEEKEDKKGTPTKIPMAKGPLTTSQSEIIRKSSEEKEQKSTPTKIPMAKSSPSNSQCESLQKTSSMVDDQNITPTRIPIAKGPLNTSSSEIIRKEEKNQKGSPTKIPIAKSPLNTSQTEIILQKSAKTSLTETKSGSVESKILPASQEKTAEQILDSGSSFESVQTSTSEVNVSVTSQSSIRSDSKDEDFSSEGEKPARTSSAKVSFDESKLAEDLKDSRFSQPDVETEFLDQQGFTYCIGDKRTSITEDEAKVAAEGLIIDIESELNKRPDIVENLLLMRHADYIRSMSVDPVDDVSNDITDEDLRSTGTETDIADCHDFYDREELQTDNVMKISEASPTEYKIDYELAEEFNVLQSVDFEEQLIAEVAHATTSQNKTFKAPRSTQLPTPNVRQSSDERKSGEESGLRIDLMSPESISSSGTPRKSEDVTSGTSGSRSKKSGDGEFCSSSSESHYQSLTLDNRTALGSRPCSSDVEVLLSCAAGSSDYETAVSHDTTSYPSHDFHTAVSSASIHESLKSIDSESSGHLGSAEVSSEISETLVASSSELEHDIDIASSSRTYDDKGRGLYRRSPLEPYDQDIPVNIIRNVGKMSTKSAESDSIAQPVPAEVHLIADSKLVSSCEDTSSVSTTDGANLPTAFEIASNDSDRMDNSLTSEQSLTMSAISNQLSTSSSDFREEIDNDRKMIDMSTSFGTSQGVSQTPPTSVTLFTSTNEHQEKQNVCTQVTSSTEGRRRPSNEALPESLECKDETPPKTTAILTQVKYFTSAGTPEDGSGTFESVTFEQEKQAPEEEMFEHEVQDGKKWMELQFQAADAEGTIAYEYAYERAPLEDIKEEDTDDMQSSKMGSVGSQISQSIPSVGSAGSMKQSLSSTPDYDIMAAKRGQGKAPDPDSVSQASLQEFERLEQMMSLESMKGKLSSSQDSIASSDGSGGKKRSSDNISVTSLKEFEGLEHACMEVEKIEERAKAEERSLSQIEEGHESQASESESCETLEKSVYDSDEDASNYDQKMFDIDEIIRQAQTNVEKFVDPDRLERTESLGRGDSFEETSRIPDLELDQPLADANHSSSEVYSGKKYIENVDISHSLTVSTDSLELKQAKDTLLISTDSLEGKVKPDVASDSLEDEYRGNTISDRSCVSEKGSDIPHDELDNQPCHLSPNPISSPDSVDAFTSSTATHATYHNEGDSVMSSSFTSGGSNTMISSTENLENVVSNYSNWLEGGQHYVSETVETISEDKSYSTVQRTVEGTEGAKVVYRGPDAKAMLERDLESFRPGEFYSETREVDADGNVCVKRVIETRSVLSSEQVKNSQTITLENRTTSDFSSELLSHVQQQQSGKVRTGSSDKNEQPHSSVETKDEKTKNEKKEQK